MSGSVSEADYAERGLSELADLLADEDGITSDEVLRLRRHLVAVFRYHSGHCDGRAAAARELRRLAVAFQQVSDLLVGGNR